jgi:hypothetical protein
MKRLPIKQEAPSSNPSATKKHDLKHFRLRIMKAWYKSQTSMKKKIDSWEEIDEFLFFNCRKSNIK